ncbi:MAG: ATP-binding protein, partial [Micrococcales bacterium]|nr:ATP-binding protein [Micrococcales bacterium]
ISTVITCFVVWFAFFVTPAVPLSFLFVSLVIWVASTRGVNETAVYAMAVSAASIMLTLANIGPFAQQPIMARAALGQGLSLVLCMTAMSIVLAREEQSRLVSQVRASQAATIAQAVLMDGIVATMDDGLVVFSEDGSVLLANATAHDLLNWPEDSWDNVEALAPLFSPDGSQSLLVNQALRSREPEPVDVMPVRPEGAGERIISARAVPFAHEGTVQVVVVLFDVTEQRRRTAELTSFAGVIAHDLLNPLGAVEGWTEMLADEIADAHPGLGEGPLRRITASAARMRGIISGLLSYSVARDGTLSRIDLDLRELVQDVVDARSSAAIAMGAQIPDFRIDVDASVRVDRALVAQVLDNLMGNAAKYTASSERPVIEVSAMRAVNGWVTVRVEDRGIGLPPGQEDVVFEEFHRVPEHRGSYVGTGLGLSICKRIVERHGGRVAAHRRQGGGSSFVLTLPAAGSLVPTVLDQDAVIEQARASSAAAEKAAMVQAQQDQFDWVLAQPRSRLDAPLAESPCLQGSGPGKQSSGGNTSERPTT